MITPPSPGFQAQLLADVGRWGFRVSSAESRESVEDIGTLIHDGTEYFLVVVNAGPRMSDWSMVPVSEIPAKLPGYRLTRRTFELLRVGTAQPDGSIDCDGHRYRICATWNGAEHVAEAVAE